jgi:hypothetical protein
MISFDPFKKENLFYKYKVKITEEELQQIKILIKHKKYINPLNSSTFFTLNILNFPILKNLKKQITDILEEHDLVLGNSWAQYYNTNNSHGVHIHEVAKKSGIIYLCSKGSPTTFYNRTFEAYENKIEKNTLILFPSFIPHEVKPLSKDEERLVLSFNAMYNC